MYLVVVGSGRKLEAGEGSPVVVEAETSVALQSQVLDAQGVLLGDCRLHNVNLSLSNLDYT